MNFCTFVLELHLLRNFSHTRTDTQRRIDIFKKLSNRVQDIPNRVNPSKNKSQKFAQNQKKKKEEETYIKDMRIHAFIYKIHGHTEHNILFT